MARSSVNFPLIFSTLLLLSARVFAVDPRGSKDATLNLQLCNFDEDNRMYNATDLLLCMNEQARNILFQQSTNPNRITDRAYQDTRQSYPAYPFAPAYSIPPAYATTPSNYFTNQLLPQLLSGGFALPNLSNLLDLSSFTKPGFNFFKALSSIAQYDDLKCVPRILCEVASGSMPGSLSYRQNSGYENFGSNALFGLLSAFDTSGTSPILSFGRAALLGYTNRGQPHTCYREYSRCPRDSAQLISYLNNHNGGFFRLFNGNRGTYYPQQYYGYRPTNYYKNSEESENRIIKKTEYPTSQIFSEADVEQGGFDSLTFGDSDYYHRESNSKPDFFTSNVRESGPSKIVFPKDKREDKFVSNYFDRPFNSFNDFNSYHYQKESVRKDKKFFPANHVSNNYYTSTPNKISDNRRPRFEDFDKKDNYVSFPRDTDGKKESPFFFPNNYRYRYKDF